MEIAINLSETDLSGLGFQDFIDDGAPYDMVRCDTCGALIPVDDSEGECPSCGFQATR